MRSSLDQTVDHLDLTGGGGTDTSQLETLLHVFTVNPPGFAEEPADLGHVVRETPIRQFCIGRKCLADGPSATGAV
jgi:hypothetical protein